MPFGRPPAADDPQWPRASGWLAGTFEDATPPALEVVGVPSSVGSISPSEAWQTPPAVRGALARLSPYDPDGAVDVGALPVRDLGDWDVASVELHEMVASVRSRADELARGPVHLFLGGDNAITRPLVVGRCGPDLSRVGVVTLDAHHDVRTLDGGPRNGTPIRGLLEDGLPGRNVVQIGIGTFTNSRPYRHWCDERGIGVVTADAVRRRGVGEIIDGALEDLDHCDTIYVDFDVDVLDVAFAPACPGARPGGLAPDQLLAAARRLGAEPRVVAADLVEVDAAADPDGRTVMVTAMTLLAFASGVARRQELAS